MHNVTTKSVSTTLNREPRRRPALPGSMLPHERLDGSIYLHCMPRLRLDHCWPWSHGRPPVCVCVHLLTPLSLSPAFPMCRPLVECGHTLPPSPAHMQIVTIAKRDGRESYTILQSWITVSLAWWPACGCNIT